MTWSPSQYLKFEDHRTRPAINLLARVENEVARAVVDLGCGPGNSTELLADRYGAEAVIGLDSSSTMIEAAKKRLPACSFLEVDLSSWAPEKPQDILFANAVLQWLPDHENLLPRLMSYLDHGGTLAVQMPDNLDEHTHVSMRAAATDARWAERLAPANSERSTILSANEYWSVLKQHARKIEIWRTTYIHPLNGLDGIVEWFKSTGLLPYLNRLSDKEKVEYLAIYRRYLAQHYPVLDDGIVLLPFPRIFIVASR